MDIISLGHSSFKISGKTVSVVTDPFDQGLVGLKFPKVEADIITVSHNHPDHNRSDLVENVYKIVDEPGEYEIKGVSFLGFSSYHDDKKGEERGKNTIFVIEIDGIRIAHLGDLGHTLSESQASQLGNVDVLLVPVGGEYTIGAKDAIEVVKAVDPIFIIPMHYKVPGLSDQLSEKLKPVDEFVNQIGLTPETTSKLSIKEGALPLEQKLVILTRK